MKKIPISFNDELLGKEKEIAILLGVEGTYGEVPSIIRFSINFTLSQLKKDSKVIPDLNPTEIELWFTSIKRLHEEEKKEKELEKLQKA